MSAMAPMQSLWCHNRGVCSEYYVKSFAPTKFVLQIGQYFWLAVDSGSVLPMMQPHEDRTKERKVPKAAPECRTTWT